MPIVESIPVDSITPAVDDLNQCDTDLIVPHGETHHLASSDQINSCFEFIGPLPIDFADTITSVLRKPKPTRMLVLEQPTVTRRQQTFHWPYLQLPLQKLENVEK